jgi:hypothetical protein
MLNCEPVGAKHGLPLFFADLQWNDSHSVRIANHSLVQVLKMRYEIILQHSEEDCGAACLATVAKHEGRIFAISFVKEYYKN